jgi:hypothetical protein
MYASTKEARTKDSREPGGLPELANEMVAEDLLEARRDDVPRSQDSQTRSVNLGRAGDESHGLAH